MSRRAVPIASWLAAMAISMIGAAVAEGAPGDLDETFSRDGFTLGSDPEVPRAVTAGPNGSVLVAGVRESHGRARAAVARYSQRGRRDRRFGRLASRAVDLTERRDSSAFSDVAIASDGGIVLAGELSRHGDVNRDFVVMKLRGNGERDESFGSTGIVTVDLSTIDRPTAMAIGDDGRITVVGFGGEFRLFADGAVDHSFADNDLGAYPQDVAIADDGGTLLAGQFRTSDGDYNAGVIRLTPNGAIDSQFGEDGLASIELPSLNDSASSVAVDPGGRILLGANSCTDIVLGPGSSVTCGLYMIAFSAAGSLDQSFGSGGVAAGLLGDDLIVDPRGRFLVAGYASPQGLDGFPSTFAIERLTSSGKVDEDFARRGRAYAYRRFHVEDAATDPRLALSASGEILLAAEEPPTAGHIVIRFERGRRRDQDGDGLGDARDACDLLGARRDDGCLTAKVAMTLNRGGPGVLVGELHSNAKPCIRGESVRVLRRGPGDDARVATIRVDDWGRWSLRRALRPGRYYALTERHQERQFGTCKRAISEPVRLARRPQR